MSVEITQPPERVRLAPVSWSAIFASLAVAISVMLLFTLAGVAVGVSGADPADGPGAITMAAATWQTISMLIAAVVGGYVAARLSGLRRTADGLLHGAVSWGATTLLYAALATTALGTLTAGMFGLLAPEVSERAVAAAAPAGGDREDAQRTLERIGVTPDQARTVLDQLMGPDPAQPVARQQAEEAARRVGTATGWLSATVLLSLVLSLIGGATGSRGSRRANRRLEARAPVTPAVADTSATIVSRPT